MNANLLKWGVGTPGMQRLAPCPPHPPPLSGCYRCSLLMSVISFPNGDLVPANSNQAKGPVLAKPLPPPPIFMVIAVLGNEANVKAGQILYVYI